MRSLSILAPAKVNLYLEVLGKRKDGYHEIRTIFHRVSLCDRLTVRKIKERKLHIICDHPALQVSGNNIIAEAFSHLSNLKVWTGGVEVILEKRIPIAAGLGGGSSDAAHFMLAVNRLFGLDLPRTTLVRLGRQVGADVPFFLYEVNQAIGCGKGDCIRSLPAREPLWLVLVCPDFGLSTKRVYKSLKARQLTRISPSITITSDLFRHFKGKSFPCILRNDLYPASTLIRPELKVIRSLLREAGAENVMMSGSGPAMMSMCRSKSEAEHIARRVRAIKPEFAAHVCRSY